MAASDSARRSWLRRALFQVHLWTGLAVGLYVFVSGVSGSALVFHEELADLAQAGLREIPPGELAGRRLTLDEARSRVAAALPEQNLLSIAPPRHLNGPFEAGLFKGRYRIAFVHPVSGEITGPVEPGGAVLGWLHELHANLLTGGTGRWLNGIGGGLLVLLCVTGLVIWWPGRGKWRRSMTIDFTAGWKRQVFDLHNATGFWLLIPVLIFAVTGSYFTWPRQYRAAIAAVSPLTPSDPPRSDVTRRGAERPRLEDMVAVARQRGPAARVVRVATPARPEQPVTVFISDGGTESPRSLTRYFFDQHTGELLRVASRGISGTAGDHLVAWLGPLHTGNFGGAGVKAAYVVLGLAPAVLFATGFLMWWNRVVTSRWRAARRASSPQDKVGLEA
ncbi:MAG: PepSY-associated TM helix domain-containing protein [Vicinamibacterales bacterium]